MRSLFATLAILGTAAEAAELTLVDEDRVVIYGASNVNPYWPHYLATYLILRNPDKELGIYCWAQSGTAATNWLDSSNAYYGKLVRGLSPDHNIIQFSRIVGGTYEQGVDALVTLAEDYGTVLDGASQSVVGPLNASSLTDNSGGRQLHDAIVARIAAQSYTWNYAETIDYGATYWQGYKAATVNDATDVFTVTAHGWEEGARVRVSSTAGSGGMPGGFEEFVDYYVRDGTTDSLKLAATLGGAAIDATSAGSGVVVSRDFSDAQYPEGDAGHVGGGASIGLVRQLLSEWGWSFDVSQATVNAATLTATSQSNCTIGTVTANGFGGVDFTRLDARLPMAVDDEYRDEAVRLDPATANMFDYSLTVTNLPPGTYDVLINGTDVADVTAAELAAGWNMSDLTVGPVWQKGQDVLNYFRDAQDVDRETLIGKTVPQSSYIRRYINPATAAYNAGLRGEEIAADPTVAAVLADMETIEATIKAAAQPEALTFSIRRQNAWWYPGIPYTDWEYDPFTIATPTKAELWPSSSAEVAGHYYVDPDHPSATDNFGGNDSATPASASRYGYPDRPRVTLPTSSGVANTYETGAVVFISGGVFVDAYSTFDAWWCSFDGTAADPCWIIGDPEDTPVFKDVRVAFYDTTYTFIDGIEFSGIDSVEPGCVTFQSHTKNGQTHHVAVRNIVIKDKPYITSGSMISCVAPRQTTGGVDADVHDIVFYDITFQNIGIGTDWDASDYDYHGFKIDGDSGPNEAYRIWIIECNALKGASPDATDGYYKSITGSFIQVGEDITGEGNARHIYIAGNYSENTRQAHTGIKQASHVVVSSNTAKDIAKTASAQGQPFNAKYSRQHHFWFVNNYTENTPAGLIRADANSPDGYDEATSYVYIIGNVFTGITDGTYTAADASASLGAWKTRGGINLHDQRGHLYIVNNTINDAEYGIVTAGNGASASDSHIYIANNMATDLGTVNDPLGGDVVSIFANNGGTNYYIENNAGDAATWRYTNTTYATPALFNARADAANNLEVVPGYTNTASGDFSLTSSSGAIGAGISTTTLGGTVNLYDLFVTLYDADADFPGDPADVWPYDRANNARVNGTLDVGAYEYYGGPADPPARRVQGRPVRSLVSPGLGAP